MDDLRVAGLLEMSGRKLNERIHKNLVSRRKQLPSVPYMDFMLANSLVWSKHARDLKGYVRYACGYLASTDEVDQTAAAKYSLRWGAESLALVLHSLREVRKAMGRRPLPDFGKCSARSVQAYSTALMTVQNTLHRRHQADGVGPWLTKAWVKQALCHEKRLWKDPSIDGIVLPTGMEVVRGVNILANQTNLLAGWNPSLSSTIDHGYDAIVQSYASDIAARAGSIALHVNSGLYLLGAGEVTI